MKALSVTAFHSWLRAYGAASSANDARASAALFAIDARYHESPFDQPIVGRKAIERYWEDGARRFTDKESSHEVLSVRGDLGIARWRSTFTVVESGQRFALDCLFLVEFNDEGTCAVFREWWHLQPLEGHADRSWAPQSEAAGGE